VIDDRLVIRTIIYPTLFWLLGNIPEQDNDEPVIDNDVVILDGGEINNINFEELSLVVSENNLSSSVNSSYIGGLVGMMTNSSLIDGIKINNTSSITVTISAINTISTIDTIITIPTIVVDNSLNQRHR
jgi:hypothetical protein